MADGAWGFWGIRVGTRSGAQYWELTIARLPAVIVVLTQPVDSLPPRLDMLWAARRHFIRAAVADDSFALGHRTPAVHIFECAPRRGRYVVLCTAFGTTKGERHTRILPAPAPASTGSVDRRLTRCDGCFCLLSLSFARALGLPRLLSSYGRGIVDIRHEVQGTALLPRGL